jgi:hypothetical protein
VALVARAARWFLRRGMNQHHGPLLGWSLPDRLVAISCTISRPRGLDRFPQHAPRKKKQVVESLV